VARHIDDRQPGIDEYPQIERSGGNLDTAFAEIEHLAKRSARRKRIGLEGDSDSPQFEQLAALAPGVGACDVEQQIAVFFDPEIQADLPVAQGHRAVGTRTGRIPDHVAVVEGLGNFRGGSRYEPRPGRSDESASGKDGSDKAGLDNHRRCSVAGSAG
jgi:hypothetical protein